MALQNQNVNEFNRFLENNRSMVEEKYLVYFKNPQLEIESVNDETVVEFISDVFSFQNNYNSDTTTKIKQALKENYYSFLKEKEELKLFDSNVAIQVLKFSIANNRMLAVNYEQKETENSPTLQKKQSSNHEDQQEIKEKSETIVQEKSQISQQKNAQELEENEFDSHQEVKVDFDPVMIKKNVKSMFFFYCKNQMLLNNNQSFDRIEQESHMLTLSKLYIMAKLMNLYSSSITKEVLTKKFRKISSGKQYINLEQFEMLFNEIQTADPALIARSELNVENFSKKLKSTKIPFNTKDMSPREEVMVRKFKNKLTIHSGKMEEDLVQYISEKKKQRYPKFEKEEEKVNYSSLNRSLIKDRSEIVTTKNLASNKPFFSHDYGVRSKIIHSQDDDIWLGEYKFKEEKQKQGRQEKRYRKHMIIEDLKKRIKQLQRSEKQELKTREYLRYKSNIFREK